MSAEYLIALGLNVWTFFWGRVDFLLHIIVGRPGDEQEAKEKKSEREQKAQHHAGEGCANPL